MRQPDAIRLRNVTCSLGGSVVLDNVSFSVNRGAFTYMIGPNGGGKTTLLRLLLGLEKPDSGRISVLGLTPPAANRRIGYLPQHQFYDPQFPITALEAVLTGLSFAPFASGRLREKAVSALEEMGLGDEAARPYAVLSGGQRQRVLIARALVGDPELLLLDEPTANVDPAVEEALFDRLTRLHRKPTIVMVTHDTGVVPAGVERVICVNRSVAVHPTRRLTGRVLQELYHQSLNRVSHDRVIGRQGGENMAEFWQALQDPGFPFLRYALAAGLLSSVAFGILGPIVVARRIGAIAGSISHSMLGGIGLAVFLRHQTGWPGFTPGAGALAAALVSATVIGSVHSRGGEREDTVIASVWTVGMAAGVLFLSLTPVFVDPMSYLFGNILLLTRNDLWMIAGLDAILLVVVLLLYRPLLAVCFDEEFARIRGLNTGALSMLLFGLTALTVALLLPMVGTVLVIALLTLPAALAGRFTKHLWSMMIAAAAVCAVFAVAGVALSAMIDIPSGAAIVLLLGAAYLIPALFRRKR